jgi:hypothetical protein
LEKGIINMGIGYRYQLMPDSNLRLDIGFSADHAGIYLGFCEAF